MPATQATAPSASPLNPLPGTVPPFPVEAIELSLPELPAELEGFRILHLSDLHITRPRARCEAILQTLATVPCDLLAVTGDLMVRPGNEPHVHDWMVRLVRSCTPRYGIFGVWGNHDSPALRPRLLPLAMRWLVNDACALPNLPLTVLGVDCVEGEHNAPAGDLVTSMLKEQAQLTDGRPRLRILLSHMPDWLPAAGDLGVGLVLSGHTHAGQCRLPTGRIFYNATPGWPTRFSSGLLSYKKSLGAISRGLGEVYMEGLRFFCPPQLPLYTLKKAVAPAPDDPCVRRVRNW